MKTHVPATKLSPGRPAAAIPSSASRPSSPGMLMLAAQSRPLTPADVRSLQRSVGNAAVQRLLGAQLSGMPPGLLQRFPTWSQAKNHILKGDFNASGNPTGFHSTIGGSTTHQAYGTATNIANGVYERSVKGRRRSTDAWKRKAKQSTFFPDRVGDRAATEDDLENAVTTARGRADKKIQTPAEWRGIVLKSIGSTVYPDGGSDLDPEAL